jgi:hypothetical protein
MSTLHSLGACPCCMSLLDVHVAWSILHVRAASHCFMFAHVQDGCQCCMYKLHPAASPHCMSVLHICTRFMQLLYFHAACLCNMHMLNAHAVCLCCTSMLHCMRRTFYAALSRGAYSFCYEAVFWLYDKLKLLRIHFIPSL